MNKTEKLISLLLGCVLAWYVFHEMPKGAKQRAAQQGGVVAQQGGDGVPAVATRQPAKGVPAGREGEDTLAMVEGAPATNSTGRAVATRPSTPEKTVILENDQVRLELSTWGAVVKRATLKKYAKGCGAVSDANPAFELDLSASPIGRGPTVDAFEIAEKSATNAVFRLGAARRTITLAPDYRVTLADEHITGDLSLGVVAMGGSKNDILSIDSWQLGEKGGEVIHHCEGDSPFKAYLVGGIGGCSGSKDASSFPAEVTLPYARPQSWVAVKNRFFVTALVSSTEPNVGFDATIARDVTSPSYRPASVAATVKFAGTPASRTNVFYVGPKKQDLLWDLGLKDVMEFGMWRWLCYPLVWVLNLFNSWIPNYGVAIILLTILVRLIFWPLTHKSTVGMRKMQELQPKMKEIQKKFKDNPQRLQQETWQLYRTEKVNPMSSCLPMLIQIPVFIALFNVLRSAVELRYAPFLWIADLSEPEGLFASWFPFGGLNILPVLMALTTGLQSAFTPSTGDKQQQRMMMIFMPVMMLVMFYSFPSALSLYWFLSNLFSIVQMWLIRRQTAAKTAAIMPDAVIDPPATRQMRRHGGSEK